MARAIAIAIKSGGGADPTQNYKLRMAIEQAKAANVPKANIDRILSRSQEVGNYDEVTYEGYGPGGIAVIVDTATDNRNRTSQEIKNIFERSGGSLAGPGAVSYNFEPKVLMLVQKEADVDAQMLKLIDLGVEDIEESQDGLEVYVSTKDAGNIKEKLEKGGFKISSFETIRKPKSLLSIMDESKAKKTIAFLESLEDLDDVQNVYSNLDIPEDIAKRITQ